MTDLSRAEGIKYFLKRYLNDLSDRALELGNVFDIAHLGDDLGMLHVLEIDVVDSAADGDKQLGARAADAGSASSNNGHSVVEVVNVHPLIIF